MATPKQVTINDVDMGILYIHPIVDGLIKIERNYTLTGTDQTLLDLAGTFVVSREVSWSTLPQTVKDALTVVDDWTRDEALSDRGMS